MDDKLVECVAKVACVADEYAEEYWPDYLPVARAAIRVVIEECAKVADDECERTAGINADRYWQSRRIRDAIRALKEPK